MKNLVIISVVLVFTLSLVSSCKKRYKCSCDNYEKHYDANNNLIDSTLYTVENPYLHKLSKSEADTERAQCEATNGCSLVRDK